MAVTNIRYLLLFLQKHPENHTTPSLINYDQEQCIQTKSYWSLEALEAVKIGERVKYFDTPGDENISNDGVLHKLHKP